MMVMNMSLILHSTHLNAMARKTLKMKQPELLSTQTATESKKRKPTGVHLPVKNVKKYTKRELQDTEHTRQWRYRVLLDCARRKDMSTVLALPTADELEVPMTRACHTLEQQVELLDIYHYLHSRKENLSVKLTFRSFGPMVGITLPGSTLILMLQRESEIRASARTSPPDAHYIVHRKDMQIEEVLHRWLLDQRKKRIPVSSRMIRQAANATYTILCDLQDHTCNTTSEAPPSFSVA